MHLLLVYNYVSLLKIVYLKANEHIQEGERRGKRRVLILGGTT
jgi:hypothetical protein